MRKTLLIAVIALLAGAIPAHACQFFESSDHCAWRHWRHRAEERREIRHEVRREERHEERREAEERCKPPVHAVGEADHLKEAAKRSAIHYWQMQVVNEWGERYMDYSAARIVSEEYTLAGIGADVITNTKRYVITAMPCLRDANAITGEEEVPR